MERLDKLISQHCALSRKEAKLLIRKGNILYNGKAVLPEQAVDPETDTVQVDGKILELRKYCYLMLHKPGGILSAARDKQQKTVVDLVPKALWHKGLFPAGRLDKDSTGFVLLTNDGALAHRLLSPKNRIYKTYVVALANALQPQQIALLESGIPLQSGERCLPAKLTQLEGERVEICICEGKYHQIKRMIAACGNTVLQLHRAKIGGLALDAHLQPGECRAITKEELEQLFT